jgi:proline dehydrogenase
LALALADARANNYAIGVKLVRGAYHPHELAAHRAVAYDGRSSMSISPDVEPPVWLEKRETDEAYNGCLKVLIKAVKEDVERCGEKAVIGHTVVEKISTRNLGWFGLFTVSRGAGNTDNIKRAADKKRITPPPPPSIGVLFGTHNWTSCGLILQNLVDAGLAVTSNGQEFKPEAPEVVKISDEAVERIAIGQLYGEFNSKCAKVVCSPFFIIQKGMDDLTDWVVKNTVSNTPFVIK